MIAELLTENYYKNESWHKIRLPYDECVTYHKRLLMNGNIITIIENDWLKAYMEVWRINYEQLGRIMCGVNVFPLEEDISHGNIAYVNNAWVINKEFDPILYSLFVQKFGDCEFLARKRFKYNESFKVYPMRSLICPVKKQL